MTLWSLGFPALTPERINDERLRRATPIDGSSGVP